MAERTIRIKLPPDAKPGKKIRVPLPGGGEKEIMIPKNHKGKEIEVTIGAPSEEARTGGTVRR